MTDGAYRVVVTDQVFPSVELERSLLAEDLGAELVVADGGRDEVLSVAEDADALLNTFLPLDAEALYRLRRCRIVARYGIGVDNIDLEAAAERGIVVTNVPDYCVEEVATHALALLLAVLRKLPQGDSALRRGEWGVGSVRPITRLSELTVGLVGYGRIARALAEPLRALGASIIVHDPYLPVGSEPASVSLSELLSTADAVSLHTPLTPETRELIRAETLELMQPHAVLVNTSRGPLVAFDDLCKALVDNRLAGAALDVFDVEPIDPKRLEGIPNLLATPHAAFYSEAALRESQQKATRQIMRVLRGESPDYQVNV